MQKLIYIVEDETDILELVSMKLQAAGYETKCFERALPMLKALETEVPDLIILNLMLPDLTVWKPVTIKGNPATENIPILMLTARSGLKTGLV